MYVGGYRADCYRQEDSLDSGLSSDGSTLYRSSVPWSGNAADRSKLNHVRRPDPPSRSAAAAAAGGGGGGLLLPLHHGPFSDSETDADGPRLGWGRGQCQAPSGERRVQDWTERNVRQAADCYTLGARRHRHLYNGLAPAPINTGVNAGVAADLPLAGNTNRFAVSLVN